MKSKFITICAVVMLMAGMVCGKIYNQGFESDTEGMIVDPAYGESITRMFSGGGTLGVPSASGNFHAEISLNDGYGNGVFTRNGGYSSHWPGYIKQSIKVYIDPAAGAVNDGWFWDPGISNAYGTWGRGGGFGVQKTASGTWSIGAEDDYGGFDYVGYTAWTTHTNTTPLQITTAGWYQLVTEWVENSAHTRVNQINTVLDSSGSILWTDTLPNCMSLTPGQDDTIGGIRYSWIGSQGPQYPGEISPRTGLPIVPNTMSVLAIDDVEAYYPTWDVATVHGYNQFTIGTGSLSLLYHQQPRNTKGWYWYNNNGSPPGTLATGGFGPNGWRDGSRTFACTDVAAGQALNSLKLAFDYKTALGYCTINFFMTDGAGKFGIFAPTSAGLAAFAQYQVLDSTWTRVTIDLTQAGIPDTTLCAVYEHNGLSDDYVEPFTSFEWGDIKNLTIAGMYDYQRSPANGWSYWGNMFSQINTAGSSTIANGYGLALIWGDTVGNNTYVTQQREIRNVTVSFGGTDYTNTFANAQIANVLKLDVEAASIYVKPGENVITDMDVSNLAQKVNGCQAMLGYSSTYLQASAGCVVAGGGVWDDLIYNSWDVASGIPGEIDTAIGIDANSTTTGTDADGTVAVITLNALTEGVTEIVFRADDPDDETKQTLLSDMNSQAVWPRKLNSVTIVIDGTDPDVAVTYPNGGEILKGGSSCTITWTAADTYIDEESVKLEYYDGSAWVEIASGENNDGSYDWIVPLLDISTARVRVSVSDLAGNTGSDTSDADFTIDSTNPAIDIVSASQNSQELLISLGSTINAVQGDVTIKVAASDALSGLAGMPTVTVTPNGGSVQDITATGVDNCDGTFSYTCTVVTATPNGTATINASVSDKSGNSASDSDTFNINKNNITGNVSMATYSSVSYSFDRNVVFSATDSGGNVLKSWTETVSFSNSSGTASGSYVLTDVPSGTASLSAKTDWSLRQRQAVSFDGNGQATVNFTVLGGDLDNSNSVNILDYSIFKVNYGTGNAVADINGDGSVNSIDYFILRINFFKVGDLI